MSAAIPVDFSVRKGGQGTEKDISARCTRNDGFSEDWQETYEAFLLFTTGQRFNKYSCNRFFDRVLSGDQVIFHNLNKYRIKHGWDYFIYSLLNDDIATGNLRDFLFVITDSCIDFNSRKIEQWRGKCLGCFGFCFRNIKKINQWFRGKPEYGKECFKRYFEYMTGENPMLKKLLDE